MGLIKTKITVTFASRIATSNEYLGEYLPELMIVSFGLPFFPQVEAAADESQSESQCG
jgi:hypothetical protein